MAYGIMATEATQMVRHWLESNSANPGARLPSERDLAKQLGLKHYAVNRAISRLIAEGLIERTGYKLTLGTSRLPASDFSCEVLLSKRSIYIKSYRKLAKELGLHVRIHGYQSLEEAKALLRQFDVPETQSVIFEPPHGYPSSLWESAMTRLLEHGIGAISVRQHAAQIPSVLADYGRAMEQAFLHLRDLGHSEMALVTLHPRAPVSIEIFETWQSLCAQHDALASQNRTYAPNSANALREDAREVAQRLAKDWKEVTALIIYADGEPVVVNLLEELSRRKKRVPKSLSIVCIGDPRALRVSNPPITTVTFDSSLMQETALRMAQRMVRKKPVTGLLPSVWSIRVQANMVLRASTAPPPSYVSSSKTQRKALLPSSSSEQWEENSDRSNQKLNSLLKAPYKLTAGTYESRYKGIDLSPHVNRPLNFRRGWLGDLPLKSLTAGTHLIHGIPFRVLGGTSRSQCGAVVFRSTINTTGSAKALPSELRIPIDSTAISIYILHGCGYARFMQPFATYQFYSGTKRLGAVPLIALGLPPPKFDIKKFSATSLKANIQDWWPDFPHVDFPHARRVPLTESEIDDPIPHHAYLYTLEWINPSPESKISHMTISVDSTRSTTLGLLAISVLKK